MGGVDTKSSRIIDNARHWRYPSARDYEGESSLIDICRS